jgi:hypothetical protein
MNKGTNKKNIEKLQKFLIQKQNEIHDTKSSNKQTRTNTARPRTA